MPPTTNTIISNSGIVITNFITNIIRVVDSDKMTRYEVGDFVTDIVIAFGTIILACVAILTLPKIKNIIETSNNQTLLDIEDKMDSRLEEMTNAGTEYNKLMKSKNNGISVSDNDLEIAYSKYDKFKKSYLNIMDRFCKLILDDKNLEKTVKKNYKDAIFKLAERFNIVLRPDSRWLNILKLFEKWSTESEYKIQSTANIQYMMSLANEILECSTKANADIIIDKTNEDLSSREYSYNEKDDFWREFYWLFNDIVEKKYSSYAGDGSWKAHSEQDSTSDYPKNFKEFKEIIKNLQKLSGRWNHKKYDDPIPPPHI